MTNLTYDLHGKQFTNISKSCVRSYKALSIPALCPCARGSPRRAAEPGASCSKIWNKNPNWSSKYVEMFHLLHSRFAGQSLSLLHFLETKKSFSRIDFLNKWVIISYRNLCSLIYTFDSLLACVFLFVACVFVFVWICQPSLYLSWSLKIILMSRWSLPGFALSLKAPLPGFAVNAEPTNCCHFGDLKILWWILNHWMFFFFKTTKHNLKLPALCAWKFYLLTPCALALLVNPDF